MDLELILAIIRNQCDLEKYSKNKLRLKFRKEIAWKQSEVFLKGRTQMVQWFAISQRSTKNLSTFYNRIIS